MKKNYWIFIIMILISCKTTKIENTIEIYSHDQDVLTIRPRNKKDVINEGNYLKQTISTEDYNSLKDCLNNVNEITSIKKNSFKLELDFNDNNKNGYLKNEDDWFKEIDEYDLNITHVVILHHNGKDKEILIGEYLGILKIDKKFFKITQKDFLKLLEIIEKYTGI